MSTLLIKDALVVATMDEERREIPGCDVLVQDGLIAAVGQDLEATADEMMDAHGCVVLPGFVNTHNHSFQALYRSIRETQDCNFVDWITFLAGLWARKPFSPDAVHAAALANFAELLMTGCTTTADQHYPYPAGQPASYVDRTIDAATEIGIRFHPARGCVTMGRADGGLVADDFAQTEDEVLKHAEDLISRYHDPGPNSMVRINLAPLGLYSDTETIYREMAMLARSNSGVGLHTHLHEIVDEEYSRERYGIRPLEFMERVGWLGQDVVFYHAVSPPFTPEEIRVLAESGSWLSSCVGSDLRLGYGLAPIRELLDVGGNACLGTTGPASNCGADMLLEAKLCMLAHRLKSPDPDRWLSGREVLWLATRGGALALGRDDVGSIEPGKGADLAIFDLNRVDMVGQHDPVGAVLFQGVTHLTRATLVNGRVVVRDGTLVSADQDAIIREANGWAKQLVDA